MSLTKLSLAGISLHGKKGLGIFPSPARMSLTKLILAGNNLAISSPRKVWSKQIQESRKFLYSAAFYSIKKDPPQKFCLFFKRMPGPD